MLQEKLKSLEQNITLLNEEKQKKAPLQVQPKSTKNSKRWGLRFRSFSGLIPLRARSRRCT